jgi:hypothetical protein
MANGSNELHRYGSTHIVFSRRMCHIKSYAQGQRRLCVWSWSGIGRVPSCQSAWSGSGTWKAALTRFRKGLKRNPWTHLRMTINTPHEYPMGGVDGRCCVGQGDFEGSTYHHSSYDSGETRRPPLPRWRLFLGSDACPLYIVPKASHAENSRCDDGATSNRRLHRCCLMRTPAEDVAFVKAPR